MITQKKNPLEEERRLGFPLPHWEKRPLPERLVLKGFYGDIVPLDPEKQAQELYQAYQEDPEGKNWTYLSYGPFPSFESYLNWLSPFARTSDPLFYAILEKDSKKPLGVASYLRMDPQSGVLEVGHIHYAPALQRTPLATEAMYLMMRYVFEDLGYRRYEWKCDALNTNSRKAAERLGFTFEGIFRQAVVYKGRNRDTAWYSLLDREWPSRKKAFLAWLDPSNFGNQGLQRKKLSDFFYP